MQDEHQAGHQSWRPAKHNRQYAERLPSPMRCGADVRALKTCPSSNSYNIELQSISLYHEESLVTKFPASDPEPLTLSPFSELVSLAHAAGKEYILARVRTNLPSGDTWYDSYDANTLNKILFAVHPVKDAVLRVGYRNPLNNLGICGMVEYFKCRYDLEPGVGNNISNTSKTSNRHVPRVMHGTPSRADIEGHYIGSSHDFLSSVHFRHNFTRSSLHPDDSALFLLPYKTHSSTDATPLAPLPPPPVLEDARRLALDRVYVSRLLAISCFLTWLLLFVFFAKGFLAHDSWWAMVCPLLWLMYMPRGN